MPQSHPDQVEAGNAHRGFMLLPPPPPCPGRDLQGVRETVGSEIEDCVDLFAG